MKARWYGRVAPQATLRRLDLLGLRCTGFKPDSWQAQDGYILTSPGLTNQVFTPLMSGSKVTFQ
jgi:hypothetical protein